MSESRTTAVDISVAELLDAACIGALQAEHSRNSGTVLRVDRRAFDLIARAKAKEVNRGQPLILLGMVLIADDSVVPGKPEIV